MGFLLIFLDLGDFDVLLMTFWGPVDVAEVSLVSTFFLAFGCLFLF